MGFRGKCACDRKKGFLLGALLVLIVSYVSSVPVLKAQASDTASGTIPASIQKRHVPPVRHRHHSHKKSSITARHSEPSRSKLVTKRKLSREERLAEAEQALRSAKTDEESQQAWDRAENLRVRSLDHATRLLCDESEQRTQAGDLQKALDSLNAAIALQPDNGFLRRNRAELRIAGNDPTGAVQDLALTLRNDPKDPIAWVLLAKTQEILHHNNTALKAFEIALSHAPRFPGGKEMLKYFRQNIFGKED